MAQHILKPGVLGYYPPGKPKREPRRIASGVTVKRYRLACTRAERQARLLRLEHKASLLSFLLTQTFWSLYQKISGVAYAIAGAGMWMRGFLTREGIYTAAWDGDAIPGKIVKNQRRIVTALLFCVTGSLFFSLSVFRVSLEVTMDGENIGYVANQQVVRQSLDAVSAAASDILNKQYSVPTDIRYRFSIVNKKHIFDQKKVENRLLAEIPEIERLHVVYADDEAIGATRTKWELDFALDSILEKYAGRKNENLRFSKEYETVEQLASVSLIHSKEEIHQALTEVLSKEISHTVKSGQSAESIADSYGLTKKDISFMNPGVKLNKLSKGDTLLVKKETPVLSVSYDRREVHNEPVPFETKYVEDDKMWLGLTAVVKEGKEGKEKVYTEQTFTDGYAEPVRELRRKVIDKPVTRVIASGTRVRVTTGSFIRPHTGRSTSGFGYRTLNGRRGFHYGIDYSGHVGQPIMASDGGTVVEAGWRNGYGNIIVVKHDNEFSTAYAHCSKFVARVGQKVGQGETIALTGNTGRSTGPHLHFEIRINGKAVNPALYLK
ncbi:MAG: peptidoglycan DD-metalloendopeptidase family protein [Oscillospiraceae bacterium]|nr:peptidoglycan DD-metalloendopeptidase family protein [Oscillospiraceae bacterium]